MARFSQVEVLNTIVDTGLVPIFYNASPEVTKNIARACATGGCRLLKFTNRGDLAPEVFKELSRYCSEELPEMILGVGTVLDEATLFEQFGTSVMELPRRSG